MGVKCIAWALDQPLAGNEKCVLIVLANRAKDEDGTCFPGQRDIARQAYVSEKTVERILAKLCDAGFLRKKRRFRDNGTRSSDLLILTVPWGPTDTLSGGPPTDTLVRHQPSPVTSLKQKENHKEKISVAENTIFAYWKQVMKRHPNTRFTAERREKIRARLRTFSEEDLRLAIDRAAADPFYMGVNDRGKSYNDLLTIFRNDTKVAEFIEQAPPKPVTRRNGHKEEDYGEVRRAMLAAARRPREE